MSKLNEAAERVRRVEAGELISSVYDDVPQHLDAIDLYENDCEALGVAFARELDRTPVDEAWLDAVATRQSDLKYYNHIGHDEEITLIKTGNGYSLRLRYGDAFIDQATRGDVRTAARLARVELKENDNG